MIRQALLSGKHVICEKPITVTGKELRELFELAHSKNLVLMEAHKTLYTPTFRSIKEVLQNQGLGTVLEASAGFCRKEVHEDGEWRLHTPGKGALYDVGCYGLAGLFGLFGTDMTVVSTEQNTVSGTDTGGVFHMDCGGIPMTMRYSFEQDGDCDLRIHGSQGTLICRSFWKSDRYRIQSDDGEREYHFPFRSEFTFEAQQFIDRIENGIISDPATESIRPIFMRSPAFISVRWTRMRSLTRGLILKITFPSPCATLSRRSKTRKRTRRMTCRSWMKKFSVRWPSCGRKNVNMKRRISSPCFRTAKRMPKA